MAAFALAATLLSPGQVIRYSHKAPNTKFNGGCIQEDHTHWQCEGEIKQTATIPGLINYYYREKTEA